MRWVTAGFGCLLMVCAGTIYLLPAWGDGLRSQAQLSVSDYNLVATGLNAGTWLGVIGGALYDKVGPLPTGFCATVLLLLGYFGIRLCVQIIGLLVCFFGLSSGIFTVVMRGFFPDTNSGGLPSFLLFLAVSTSGLGFVAVFFQRQLFLNSSRTKELTRKPPIAEPIRAYTGYGFAICTALFIASASLSTAFSSANPTVFASILCSILPLVFVIALPCLGPQQSDMGVEKIAHMDIVISVPARNRIESDASALSSVNSLLLPLDEHTSVSGKSDYTLLRSFRSLDFWLTFIVFFSGIGSGITVVNNMFEIVISRIPSKYTGQTLPQSSVPHANDAATLLVMFSVCNTLGRLLSGYISDLIVTRAPRTTILIGACVLMCVVQLVFAFGSVGVLYLGALLLGFAYGSFFCIVPTFIAEAFGVSHFGANFGFQGLAPAAGSELLSTVVAGGMADRFAHEHFINVTSNGGQDHALHCLGPNCYSTPLLINSGICAFAAIIAVMLVLRQRSCRADTLLVVHKFQ